MPSLVIILFQIDRKLFKSLSSTATSLRCITISLMLSLNSLSCIFLDIRVPYVASFRIVLIGIKYISINSSAIGNWFGYSNSGVSNASFSVLSEDSAYIVSRSD